MVVTFFRCWIHVQIIDADTSDAYKLDTTRFGSEPCPSSEVTELLDDVTWILPIAWRNQLQ